MERQLVVRLISVFVACMCILAAACATAEPASTPVPTPTQPPTAVPTATLTAAPAVTPPPGLTAAEEALACLRGALSDAELVGLAAGRVPSITTLIAVQECGGQLGESGATFPLNVEQLECLKLWAGDDAFEAIAGGATPPQAMTDAMDTCGIDFDALTRE
ncbi:MAG: hypothetical protein HQ548_05420 [Chloroflexi bacterium]|nr:hypothetical protein [Chloroflexota bacterium]